MLDELIDRLQNRRTLILGVGDPLRGDDRLGPAPIKRFPRKVGAVLIEAGGRLCTSGGSNLGTWRRRVSLGIGGVWEDVRSLLVEPGRVEAEYRRRLEERGPEGGPRAESLGELIQAAKRRITRLIDAYEGGLMDKGEFEPRVVRARERLSQLEAESRIEEERQTAEQELRLVIGQLEAFGQRVSGGLSEADWPTRREVIRALVQRVEIDEAEVRAVYKVRPCPFAEGPERGRFQDRVRRSGVTSSR